MALKLNAVPTTKAEAIRTVYDLYLAGHTIEDITDAFNVAGVPVIHPGTRQRPFIPPALKPFLRGTG